MSFKRAYEFYARTLPQAIEYGAMAGGALGFVTAVKVELKCDTANPVRTIFTVLLLTGLGSLGGILATPFWPLAPLYAPLYVIQTRAATCKECPLRLR